jgi:hypothetical protein
VASARQLEVMELIVITENGRVNAIEFTMPDPVSRLPNKSFEPLA